MKDDLEKLRWEFIVKSGLPPSDVLSLSVKDFFKLLIATDKWGKEVKNGR